MTSLIFGLVAALAWGLHDFVVRRVSQHGAIVPLLTTAWLAGCAALLPASFAAGDWGAMTPAAFGYAAVSGMFYLLASGGLYRAFAIGPVRLVAPISASYPMLSVALAVGRGEVVSALQWLAVLAVVGGIALVARAPGEVAGGDRRIAILWAALGALGFGLTFHFGQIAAVLGSDLPATVTGRVAGLCVLGGYIALKRPSFAAVRRFWPYLVGMGLLDVVALLLVLSAGNWPNPEYASVASSIFGIVTILLAARFLGEGLRPAQWAGVGVVFAGIGYLAAG